MSRKNRSERQKERDNQEIKNALFWITFRIAGEKYYGKIFPFEWDSIGRGNVRVFGPIMPMQQNAKQIKREEMTYRLCLDPLDYMEAFQVFNTTLWTCWQKLDTGVGAFNDEVLKALGKAAHDERQRVSAKAAESSEQNKSPIAPTKE